MKKYLNSALCVVMSVGFTACGSSENPISMPGTPKPQSNIYSVQNDSLVSGREESWNSESQLLHIAGGSTVSVLEENEEGSQLRVGIEGDGPEAATLDVWVNAEDFASMDLRLDDESDPYDVDGYDIEPLDDEDFFILRKKMTYCYRYVKQYLLKRGLVKVYLPGASAYMAAKELPKHGFKKVSRGPSNAIVHDVCVYKGGPAGHGHIEVKTSKGWYYGYGYKASPIKNRTFIGCFHK